MNSSKSGSSDAEDNERRVLILDYDENFFNDFQNLFGLEGCKVVFADNEESAVKLLDTFLPEVVLVDVRIWYVSGVDLFRNLRRGRENIFCVLMADFASIDVALEAILEGAYDYLRKPVVRRDLLHVLRECFRHAASEKVISPISWEW